MGRQLYELYEEADQTFKMLKEMLTTTIGSISFSNNGHFENFNSNSGYQFFWYWSLLTQKQKSEINDDLLCMDQLI